MADAIKVDGLREFVRKLRQLDTDLPKAMRVALNDAVGIVIDEAKPRIPRRTGRAEASLKARSTRTAARVSAGGNRAPYYPWLDFGGKVGRNRSVDRPFFKEGRYIYKGYFAKREEFGERLRIALIGVAEAAGLVVDSGGGD